MEEKELERDHTLGPVGVEGVVTSGVAGDEALGFVFPLKADQLRRREDRRRGWEDMECALDGK